MDEVHEFVRGNGRTTSSYNVGWTLREIELMVKLIDDEYEITDAEEVELAGIRKKLMRKRKNLRQRRRKIGDQHATQ